MKQIFKYYFQILSQSITSIVWLALLLAVLAVSYFIQVPNQQQTWAQNLVQLQSLLLFCWSFLIIQITYWACQIGYDIHTSRLCLWWEAAGVNTIQRILGQTSALLVWALFVGWIVVPIIYTVLTLPIGTFSLHLLLEHSLLYFLASLILILLGLVLSPLFKPAATFLFINLTWFIVMFAGDILRDIILQFPYIVQTAFGFIGLIIPPFTILFRPGALFYQWTPLSAGYLAGIVLLSLTYAIALFFIGMQTSKAKKF